MIDHFARFYLPADAGSAKDPQAMRAVSRAIGAGLERRGVKVDPDGEFDSEELSGITIRLDQEDFLAGVSPSSDDPRWELQVQLRWPALFRGARDKQLAKMKVLEQHLHALLADELKATNIVWHQDSRRGQAGQSAP